MNINPHAVIAWCLLLTSITASFETLASSDKDDASDDALEQETFQSIIKNLEAFDGIFTLYQDPLDGSLLMQIEQEQLDKEYLYFAFVQNGVVEAGSQRGFFSGQDVIEIRKRFNRIEFVKINTNYYIDPDSPLANGGYANITNAVLASVEIKATSEDAASFLIDADGLFKTEALAQVTYNLDPDQAPSKQFNIGELSSDKTSYTHIGVYPENLNVRTDYVYSNKKPFVGGSERVADARATTVTVQHSFLNMPDNDFVPRFDDNRVGYFRSQITDLNSFEFAPYRDLITRWHLVKKDPNAAISEPVEPIVLWIENTTRLEYREIMRQGVLAWNSSFEKAGFKNAIVVNIQPDDADWSADDIRYNVVRWSNTPDSGFAFGPSYINPRTGQILGGDVMFEHGFLSTYGFRGDVLANPDADGQHDTLAFNKRFSHMHCAKGHQLKEIMSFGHLALRAVNASVSDKRKIIEQMLYELMLHEVGHTLGLMHNMKASQFRALESIHDENVTRGILTSSVMDYTGLNIAPPGTKQGDFFTVKPGPYDDWAIQFGYDPTIEGEARLALLERSTEPQHSFGNDADDMRSPGAGIDPYITIWDLSDDAIGFATQEFELVDAIAPNLLDKMYEQDESYGKVRAAMSTMIRYKSNSTAVVANYIGGVKVDRARQGQVGRSTPYMPVDAATQKKAMKVLQKHVLSPSAFTLPSELIAHSGMQARGFEHFGTTEDPKIHEAILRVQSVVFDRLLNAVLMSRMTDTELYGNQYSVNQMLSDLSSGVFETDIKSDVNSRRQNLQIEYIHRLSAIFDASSEYDHRSKAAAFVELKKIESLMDRAKRGNDVTKAHRLYAKHLVTMALEPAK
jgi:hypothetical protein